MEGARVREIIEETITVLDEQLEDPISQRSNNDESWIFDHFPYEQSMPHIGVHKVGKGYERKGIGQVSSRENADFQVTIRARRKKYYDIDGDGNNEPAEDIIDFFEREVKNVIEDEQDRLRNLDCVRHVLPVSSNRIGGSENQNWIGTAITYETVVD